MWPQPVVEKVLVEIRARSTEKVRFANHFSCQKFTLWFKDYKFHLPKGLVQFFVVFERFTVGLYFLWDGINRFSQSLCVKQSSIITLYRSVTQNNNGTINSKPFHGFAGGIWQIEGPHHGAFDRKGQRFAWERGIWQFSQVQRIDWIRFPLHKLPVSTEIATRLLRSTVKLISD